MRRRALRAAVPVVVMGGIGYVFGGLVGTAVAIVAAANRRQPDVTVRWIVIPLFIAMVAATILQGRLSQDMAFGADRRLAHLLGQGLAIALLTIAVTTRSERSDDPPPTPTRVDAS